MRTFLFFSISLLIIGCESPEKVTDENEPKICDCKELQRDLDYNIHHLGDRLKPFTGKCYDYYRGGKLKKDYTLLNGKYEGELFFYHPNGQLQSSSEYQKGLLFGHKKVYDDTGQLLFHGIYKRTKLKKVIFNIDYNKEKLTPIKK